MAPTRPTSLLVATYRSTASSRIRPANAWPKARRRRHHRRDSAFDIGANALTVGTYGTFKEQSRPPADYMSGNASIEQVESRAHQCGRRLDRQRGAWASGARLAGEAGWAGRSPCLTGHGGRERDASSRQVRATAGRVKGRSPRLRSFLAEPGNEGGAATFDLMTGGWRRSWPRRRLSQRAFPILSVESAAMLGRTRSGVQILNSWASTRSTTR